VNLLMGLFLAVVTATTTAPAAREKTLPLPAPERHAVYVQSEVHDAIGALYVLKLQEALAGSSAFKPVTDPANARFVIGIVTMDPNEAEPESGVGRSTAAAITLQVRSETGLNPLLHSWVLVSNRDRVDLLVAELVTSIFLEIKEVE